ncbi:hypothetical protein DPC56_08050 [Methanothermobacter tenebrarum]|uniref:Uncharacterized protein n=1 Tax=Methanothermobacter tenebrarum TaxID=680118 RepID=A0A328P8U4_9EURY|nr:hypothetical protein DPC56_08050 [Methanothermobacter tenebrarum]
MLFIFLSFLFMGGVSAAGNMTIAAPGAPQDNPDHIIIEINQTRGWTIAGPAGEPPSKIDIQVNPEDVTWISLYFRDTAEEHFEDGTGIAEQSGLIIDGRIIRSWSFYDPWLFEGFREGWDGSHETWKSYYDPSFRISIKYKPAYLSRSSYSFPLFSKDVNVHYKNLWADGDAGFEEVISLCIAGPEALSLDPVRANWESWHLDQMTPWEIAAYGTFLAAFKTLYTWEDASEIAAQNLNLSYVRLKPAFMICGVTNGGFVGGCGYTYMHAPFPTIYDYCILGDLNNYQDYRDYDRREKAFNIVRGILLKELEAIILESVGVNVVSPVQEIMEALENGEAIIDHDPSLIEYLEIRAGQSYMFIDLAGSGWTTIGTYSLVGWICGAAGSGGACYHYELTHRTQRIAIKDWDLFIKGVMEIGAGACFIIGAAFAAPETGGSSFILASEMLGAFLSIWNGVEDIERTVVIS